MPKTLDAGLLSLVESNGTGKLANGVSCLGRLLQVVPFKPAGWSTNSTVVHAASTCSEVHWYGS